MLYRWVVLFSIVLSPVQARDNGQWESTDPQVREWYQHLMQPDNPAVSCCGEADAYWCDDVYSRSEEDPNDTAHTRVFNYCKITDNRPDVPLRRKHVDIGTPFRIPDHKMKWNPDDPQPKIEMNPTGHSIVFISRGDYVYCFVQGSGT